MILFSTLSQGWQAWLFCYLGLISGLLFFATMFFANLLTKKNKLKTISPILWKFVINFATEIIAIFILGVVVFASLFINLKLNYGSLPPVCIVLWILSFLLAKFFLKSLAKFFQSIYNKYVRQKN